MEISDPSRARATKITQSAIQRVKQITRTKLLAKTFIYIPPLPYPFATLSLRRGAFFAAPTPPGRLVLA